MSRSATSLAAKVLGREKDLGKLEAGFLADLVAIKGDPLSDPSALRDVVVVIKGGSIAIDRR